MGDRIVTAIRGVIRIASVAGGVRIGAVCAVLAVGAASAAAPVTVRDDLGRAVYLPTPAKRIVSLAPHTTELLFAAGAGAAVVGTVQHSDYPPAANHIPRIGDAAAVDLERVLALEPDLVVAWHSGNSQGTVDALRRLDVPVYLSEPRTLAGIPRALEVLGGLAGTESVARAAAATFRRQLRALGERYRGARPVSVFYQVWPQPLRTVGGAHFITDVIRLCAGRNVFASLEAPAPQVSMEAVLARDPEVIIAGAKPGGDAFARWRHWPSLQAVQARQLYTVDPDLLHRPTPRILAGARRVCESLETVRR